MKITKFTAIRFIVGAALLGAMTGCVGYVERHPATVYAPSPPVYVEPRGMMRDDYVYYPGYQVYYSSSRRHYVYLEGRSWVTRPAPRVSVDVLLRSPSVRLDFHDSPSAHHATVVRQYPKHWAPPRGNPSHGEGNWDGDKGNNRGGHK